MVSSSVCTGYVRIPGVCEYQSPGEAAGTGPGEGDRGLLQEPAASCDRGEQPEQRASAASERVPGHRGEEATPHGQHHSSAASEAAKHRDQVEAGAAGDFTEKR